MTTPPSSATTPSPPMAYLQAARPGAPTTTIVLGGLGLPDEEREQRQRAVQKFLARAELSKLTRGLRTRLSYASYKATHNMSHVQLGDLEAHARPDNATSSRASVRGRYYDGSSTAQENSHLNTPSVNAQRRASMAPPTAIPGQGSRSQHAQNNGRDAAGANAAQSLYASILSQPPAKRARTIHNPEDPPVPAPSKMTNGPSRQRERSQTASESSRTSHARKGSSQSQSYTSLAERTRAQSQRHPEESGKRKATSSAREKQQLKRRKTVVVAEDTTNSRDMDMEAAAALTHLLRHSRSSINAGTLSPRSSISAGSDVGSTQSLPQYAQSSTRTTTAQATLVASPGSSFMSHDTRPATPPRPGDTRPLMRAGSHSGPNGGGSAPPVAADQEAVKLLYFLHESPSPARPSTTRDRETQDVAAFRSLGGAGSSGDLQAKGRVLFPTASGGPADPHRRLARDNSSFASMTSTVVSEGPSAPRSLAREPTLRIDPSTGEPLQYRSQFFTKEDRSMLHPGGPTTKVTPPTPTEETAPSLLPPPASIASGRLSQIQASTTPPRSPPPAFKAQPGAPTTPGTYTFNLNDFINVSPSPSAPHRVKTGTRPSVGRKLFDEEQEDPMTGLQNERRGESVSKAPLGAGIHLAHA